jgi:CSLREA domain-containing protein
VRDWSVKKGCCPARLGLVSGFAALALLASASSAVGAVITPSTDDDDYDATTPDATCSLREAVQSAEQGSDFGGCIAGGTYTGADTIELDPGNYVLTILPTSPNNLSSGDLNVGNTDLRVEGPPSGSATIDGFGVDRVFSCFNNAGNGSFTLRGVTITDAAAGLSGPAFVSGGGISGDGCSLTIAESTITANLVDGFGGGIWGNRRVSVTNVTVSNNFSSEAAGGGIAVTGPLGVLSLDHATISNNHTQATTGDFGGGGVFVDSDPTATAHNSIIAGNTDASTTTDAPDCQGPITSTGGNVIGDTTGCDFSSQASDALNMPAMLDPLMNNGGTTMTHALQSGSPAIDHAVGASPSTDQRGYARPFPVGGACDSGAYEFGAAPSPDTPGCQPPPAPPSPAPPTTPANGTQTVTQPFSVNPLCAPLRKKLKKAKKSGNQAKVRKLRKRLRALGC